MDEIILRLVTAFTLMSGGVLAYWLLRKIQVMRLSAAQVPVNRRISRRGLEDLRNGTPAVLYFTTPTCLPCKTVQRPAIRKVQEIFGIEGVQVIEIDATVHPDLAKEWGVLSVPTTFIIDPQGNPSEVNYGVTPAEKLLQQITAARQKV